MKVHKNLIRPVWCGGFFTINSTTLKIVLHCFRTVLIRFWSLTWCLLRERSRWRWDFAQDSLNDLRADTALLELPGEPELIPLRADTSFMIFELKNEHYVSYLIR